MLPITRDSLEQITLHIMSKRPYVTAEQLRQTASRGRSAFSPAAVYKVLNKLQNAGIIVKTGSRYSLSLGWIFEIFGYANKLAETYFSESYLATLIPDKDKRLAWKFSDLMRCNEFWNQLLLALLKHTPAGDVFSWVPYPWFALLQEERESRLQKVFRMSGRTFYTSFGHDNPFEPRIRKLYSHRNQIISFALGPLSDQTNRYTDIIGDYILQVTVDSRTAQRIESLMLKGNRKTPPSHSPSLALLTRSCKITITLECNQKKAARLRGQLADFFGARRRRS